MAYENSISALPAPAAHPLAKPGYGKRSAPDQLPSRAGEFGHLPPREAYLASLLDRLCDSAAMDAKTIAKAQPLYGQQAVRSALNALSRAGHLRRVRCRVQLAHEDGNGTRWVFLTFWSRTARADDWWARFLDGAAVQPSPADDAVRAPQPPSGEPDPPEPPQSCDTPRPSAAYLTLGRLGLRDPRLALSSSDCAALEPLAADWLARDVSPDQLLCILAAGLSEQVHSPGAFVRRRLIDKMPPAPEVPAVRPSRMDMECTDCGVPGPSDALPGGLCRGCRSGGDSSPRTPEVLIPQPDVRRRAAEVRALLRAPELS